MNLDDFSTVVDDRRYINPQVSLDEQNAFINNLRSTQQARNEEIAADTYNLGTAVPSNLGGLGGSGSYFNARYQTPQTNAVVADLRAAAQAQALNDAMNNELAQAQQRYNNAYKAAQKRANSNPTTTDPDGDDLVDFEGVGDDVYRMRLSGTEEEKVDSGNTGVLRNSPYVIITGTGKRIPVNAIGYGSTFTLDTPTASYTGEGAAEYIKSHVGSGGKIIEYHSDGDLRPGEMTDISRSYHVAWGI